MTPASLILFAEGASATLSANADATGLAREQFWGVMIGVFIFVAFSIAVMTWFLRGQQGAILHLFEKSIDANAKLADAIDKLEDETRESNQKLQAYLDSNLTKIADAIREIGEDVQDHSERISRLELVSQRNDQ